MKEKKQECLECGLLFPTSVLIDGVCVNCLDDVDEDDLDEDDWDDEIDEDYED